MGIAASSHLSDKVVRSLATRTALTAQDLQSIIQKDGGRCSTAAIYKVLKQLEKAGMIIRNGNKISLSVVWLTSLLDFSESALMTLYENSTLDSFLGAHKHFKWKHTNLLRLNQSYSQLLTVVAKHSACETAYSWNPHSWFHLVQPQQEQLYLQALKKLNVSMKRVVGGNTSLDKEIAKTWKEKVIVYTFGDHHWSLSREQYFVVMGAYIVSIKLAEKTARSIDRFFHDTKSLQSVDIKQFVKTFGGTTGTHYLHLEKDPIKASQLAKKMSEAFNRMK